MTCVAACSIPAMGWNFGFAVGGGRGAVATAMFSVSDWSENMRRGCFNQFNRICNKIHKYFTSFDLFGRMIVQTLASHGPVRPTEYPVE